MVNEEIELGEIDMEPQTSALDLAATSDLAKSKSDDFVSSFERFLRDVQGLKPLFIGTVGFCRTPKKPAEVDDLYERLTEYNDSVFSAVRVRAMLEELGALAYLEPEADEVATSDEDLSAGADREDPQEGEDFLEVTVRPEGTWQATQEALDYVDGLDPSAQLRRVMEQDPRFVPIFHKTLAVLGSEPCSIGQLEEIIGEEEIMQQAQRAASSIIKKLEDCAAVEFRGKWVLTEMGRTMLADETLWL